MGSHRARRGAAVLAGCGSSAASPSASASASSRPTVAPPSRGAVIGAAIADVSAVADADRARNLQLGSASSPASRSRSGRAGSSVTTTRSSSTCSVAAISRRCRSGGSRMCTWTRRVGSPRPTRRPSSTTLRGRSDVTAVGRRRRRARRPARPAVRPHDDGPQTPLFRGPAGDFKMDPEFENRYRLLDLPGGGVLFIGVHVHTGGLDAADDLADPILASLAFER